MIFVRPKNTPELQAMQFTYENREEFKDWAAKRFGLSSNGQFMFDDDGNVRDGFIWIGRRGDDHDLKATLGDWIVDSTTGGNLVNARRYSDEQFHRLFEEMLFVEGHVHAYQS